MRRTDSGNTARTSNSAGLEEIVVTATRREENLMDVPIAVTALQEDTLIRRQIVDVESLQRIAPSLSAAPFGDASSQLLAIRGQVAQDIVGAVDPAVGTYVDGVYLGRFTGGNMAFIDVARVEVLRGPQGTLFGRNTIGGAVSITPNLPNDKLEGSVSARYGNYNAWGLTGVLNVPISNSAAFRLVANYAKRDGFARSALTGAELNDQNQTFVRGALKADLGGGWDVMVSGDYYRSRTNGQWFTFIKAFPLAETLARAASGGTQTAAQFIDPFSRNPSSQTRGPFLARNWGGSIIVNGELGAVNVKSITAYRGVNRDLNNLDQDGSPFEMLQIYRNYSRQRQFSQELQLYGKAMDDRLDWIAGAYYFHETARDEVTSHFLYPLGQNFTITDGTARNTNFAVFGQVTFKIVPKLELVAGVRYAKDERQLDVNSRNTSTLPNGTPGPVVSCGIAGLTAPNCLVVLPKRSFDYVPFTIGLNFKPWDRTLVYVKWSRGHRSGGYNTRGTTADTLLPFGPEKVDSYELGAKFEVSDVLRVSADIFQSEFKDIQILTNVGFGPGTVVAISQNAGTARIRGLELEAEAVFGPLRLGGSLALLDAKYRELLPTVVGILPNSTFAYTPKTSFALSADYTIPAGGVEVVLHGDYAWRSLTWFAPVPPTDPLSQQGDFGLVNASITAKIADRLTVSVFGKNLADKRYFNRTNAIPTLGYMSAYPGDPRTYGVSVSYKFSQ